MNLLAIETSTHMLSVALAMGESVLQRSEFCANGGSDRLLPWVRQLTQEAGVSLPHLDGIAFGSGPGSFTGLRLACGIAQGLAFGADLPVIPIITLEALALAHGPGRLLVCLDARMNEVYTAAYEVEGVEVIEIVAPTVCPPELQPLPPGKGWKACGDGFASYANTLVGRLGDAITTIDATIPPLAPAIARLALRQLQASRGVSAAEALPFYIRDKVALTTQERLARGGNK